MRTTNNENISSELTRNYYPPNPIDTLSTRHKAITLTLRSLATTCSFSVLSLFIVSLCLYLVRAPGGFDADCAFKYLSIAGATFSAAWHLFNMILMGSGTLNRVPRWVLLGLEVGSGILLGLLGYMSYAQDRIGRPKSGYNPTYGEEPIKAGALGALSAAIVAHLAFFITTLLSGRTPSASIDPKHPANRSSLDLCSNRTPLRKIPSATTGTASIRSPTTDQATGNMPSAAANAVSVGHSIHDTVLNGSTDNVAESRQPGMNDSTRRDLNFSRRTSGNINGSNGIFQHATPPVQSIPDEDAPAYTPGNYPLHPPHNSSYTSLPLSISPLSPPATSRDLAHSGPAYPFPIPPSVAYAQSKAQPEPIHTTDRGIATSTGSEKPRRHSRLFSDAGEEQRGGLDDESYSYRSGSPDMQIRGGQDGYSGGVASGMERRTSMRKEG